MPRYSYQCPNCNHEDIVKRDFDDTSDHICSVCGSVAVRQIKTLTDNVRMTNTPGSIAAKNDQSRKLMDKIKKARRESGHAKDQSAQQDWADKYMFRKRLDGVEKPRKRRS